MILNDDFRAQRRPGRVVGSRSADGALRLGRDVERQVAIDAGGLRFQPLVRPGWARQGVAYGPFARRAGLVMVACVNNGHNTSHAEPNPERLLGRLNRWLKGPEPSHRGRRLLSFLLSRQRRGILRRFRWWYMWSPRALRGREMEENLAVGFFPDEAPARPAGSGQCFVMHAALGENGELWAAVGGGALPLFRRVQNTPIHYIVVLREKGAAYYASGIDGAFGVGGFPAMRPVAIDRNGSDPMLYAGLHQSVLGQIGFRSVTRARGVRVLHSPALGAWYGAAVLADRLVGKGELGDARAERGGAWAGHGFRRGAAGAFCPEAALAWLAHDAPLGLVHCMVRREGRSGSIGVVFRFRDADNHWRLEFDGAGACLVCIEDGILREVARDAAAVLDGRAERAVQVLDVDGLLRFSLDDLPLFDGWFTEASGYGAGGAGLRACGGWQGHVRDFEAHASRTPMPTAAAIEPPWTRSGQNLLAADDFAGGDAPLEGSRPSLGEGCWVRTLGEGHMLRAGGRARVLASPEQPNPGRTLFTLPWSRPDFAELRAVMTPPGTARGQGQKNRTGLVFWQDQRNHFIFSSFLDDYYDGGSIAFFPTVNGFEELYDAIWTMVWRKIHWGRSYELAVACDGDRFRISINGEPVLVRALRDIYPAQAPLRINRVGLAVNWEWGDDTGSLIEQFEARR